MEWDAAVTELCNKPTDLEERKRVVVGEELFVVGAVVAVPSVREFVGCVA